MFVCKGGEGNEGATLRRKNIIFLQQCFQEAVLNHT